MQEYQEHAKRTLNYDYSFITPEQVELLVLGGCICEEAGEIYGKLKKQIVHKHGINKQQLSEEIGDCLWYISSLCTRLNIKLTDVMEENICKLLKRYPRGFDTEKSINRKD